MLLLHYGHPKTQHAKLKLGTRTRKILQEQFIPQNLSDRLCLGASIGSRVFEPPVPI